MRTRSPVVVLVSLVGVWLGGRGAPASAAPLRILGTTDDPVRLAAAPCTHAGDIELDEAQLRQGERKVCTATAGGLITADSIEVKSYGELVLQADDVVLTGEVVIRPQAEFSIRSAGVAPQPWADVSCFPPLDGDCNHCVDDVPTAFLRLFPGNPHSDFQVDTHFWDYKLYNYYAPIPATPAQTFVSPLATRHIQGFVQTNSEAYPFAATNSGKGNVMIIDEDLALEQIYETWDGHPSGAWVLGSFLMYGDKNKAKTGTGSYVMRMLAINDWLTPVAANDAFLKLPNPGLPGGGPTFGGGGGMVKLDSGGYLLISTGGGGDADPKTDFFYTIGDESGTGVVPFATVDFKDHSFAHQIEHLARWVNTEVPGVESTSEDLDHSENVTVIPECGTGDIYVMHTSCFFPLCIDGSYRLSVVDWSDGGPQLEPVAWASHDQDEGTCYVRAAATGYAGGDGDLEIFCSELWAVTGESEMHFTRRRPAP